jgi:hypothetical protein
VLHAVPHIFPGEFLQYYPEDVDEVPLARFPYMPVGAPNVAWHWPSDVVGINTVPCDTSTGFGCITFNETSLVTRSRLYRRSYYAAISYTDYNIGKLLKEIDTLGFRDNTVVALVGDHGWQLGEHDLWAKVSVIVLIS